MVPAQAPVIWDLKKFCFSSCGGGGGVEGGSMGGEGKNSEVAVAAK